ncbi:Increased sodium tolerance protein 2 [Nakaseomyces bracarensis]|uniref:Increased sodium tolerance protein 2 n=1 Tax=Nakaseomyces bracarensis TaxID=273131 RepID=A0ABR4NYX8_9SACH
MESLQQLDPNCVIVLKNTEKNMTQLVSELNSRGLRIVTRPGKEDNTIYAFTRFDLTDFEDIAGCLRNIKNVIPTVEKVIPIYDNEITKRIDALYKKNVKGNFLSLPTDADFLDMYTLTGDAEQSLYFAFFRNYIKWQLPMAFFGIFVRYSSNKDPWEFNPYYAAALLVWAMSFTSYWVYKKKKKYTSMFPHSQPVNNLTNDNSNHYDDPTSVLLKKTSFAPVALAFSVTLICCQLMCFSIEIFFTQIYDGPFASITSLIPTVLLAVITNVLTMIYNKFFVDKFVNWENSPNPKTSRMEKNFVLLFFVNYTPLLITLFLYLPFGYLFNAKLKDSVVSWAESHHLRTIDHDFQINTARYKSQIFFFTVTSQVVAFAMDNILPMVLEKLLPVVMSKISKKDSQKASISSSNIIKEEYPGELKRWNKVASYSTGPWGEFDVDVNYRKVIIQFGFVAMFSVLWPLSPSLYVFFNILTYKADMWRALKKCTPKGFPNIAENDEFEEVLVEKSTSSWNLLLVIITWLSTIIGPTITFMYRNCAIPGVGKSNILEKRDSWYNKSPFTFKWTSLLLFTIFIEHLSIVIYYFISNFLISLGKTNSNGIVPKVVTHKPLQTKKSIDLSDVIEKSKNYKAMEDVTPEPTEQPPKQSTPVPITTLTDVYHNNNSTQTIESNGAMKTKKDNDTMQIKETIPMQKPMPMAMDIPFGNGTENMNRPATTNTSNSIDTEADVSVAGATLPSTIPTSKNYDQRFSKEGLEIKPSKMSNSNDSSKKASVNGSYVSSVHANNPAKATVNKPASQPISVSSKKEHPLATVPLAAAAATTALNTDHDEPKVTTIPGTSNGIRNISSQKSLQPSTATQQFGRDYQPAAKPITPSSRRYSKPESKQSVSKVSVSGQNSLHSGTTAERQNIERQSIPREKSSNRDSTNSTTSSHKKKGLLHKLKKKL